MAAMTSTRHRQPLWLRYIILPICVALAFAGTFACAAEPDEAALRQTRLEDLGRSLFFDVNLSNDRTQSCATCHDPARAFTDWRDNGVASAASLGADLHSLGDRNTPTATYASRIPPFTLGAAGDYVGGLFWDGRAATLEEQAAGPPFNPVEMAMPDKDAALARLQESPVYAYAFKQLFGEAVLDDADQALQAVAASIAAFERTELFAPFDSKYDRYLAGAYTPTEQELLGLTLFFSNQFTNCNKCHQLNTFPESAGETFTNYKYRNIGVPPNLTLRNANGLGAEHVDRGLLDNPAVTDLAQAGRFRVPTLRNVALTAPYMHNGVFVDLRTVVLFYNKYLARGSKAQINPETGARWAAPEVAANLAFEELESGRALDERSIDALVAFMRMLTDRRYEALLEFDAPGSE
jgi:cytochrome c peroxidase